ncbi:hypothetical protein [Sphingomonas jatrophae]|uniref:hypothetical protein n=1 Tax=Sphingomonas jatrophae TaxID=1166337 RepID=UPI001041FB55|nr:hypothetical protein [Sphingomonas jatrophae]
MVLLIADYLFYRLMSRLLVRLFDCLPPYRPGARYRSQSTPERYAALLKRRKVRFHHIWTFAT